MTKKSKQKDPLYQWALGASVVSMGVGLLLFMVIVVSQGSQLKTQLAAQNQRELIPNQNTAVQPSPIPSTPEASQSSSPSPAGQATAEPDVSTEQTTAAPETPVVPASNIQVSANPTTPPTGLPENMILAFAVMLGIIGSATFVILRRGM